MLAGELLGAAAVVRAHLVHAHAAVEAQRGHPGALVHVLLARLAVEGRRAGADVGRVERRALAAVGARVGGARVGEMAHFTFEREKNREKLRSEEEQGGGGRGGEDQIRAALLHAYLTSRAGSGSGRG